MNASRDEQMWDWVYRRWGPIAYRTKRVVHDVTRQKLAVGRWWPQGRGETLRFERFIDPDAGTWPHDREVISVKFDSRGRLTGWRRHKEIQTGRGKSHDSLRDALGLDR